MPGPYFLPNDLSVMTTALWTWVNGQVGTGGAIAGLAAAPYSVLWAEQDAPAAHPYATLRIVDGPKGLGTWPVQSLSADGTTSLREYDSEMTLRVSFFSKVPLSTAGIDETQQLAHALDGSLCADGVLQALQDAGLAGFLTKPPIQVPQVAGFGRERRTYIEIILRARTRIARPVIGTMDATTFPTGSAALALTDAADVAGSVSTPDV